MRARRTHVFRNLGIILISAGLWGCTHSSHLAQSSSTKFQPPTLAEVIDFTKEHEHAIDDGWWFSQYPRIMKTGYAGASPKLKARFAIDYADMLKSKHEDLVDNWDSYVPYTERANFADQWWRENDDTGLFAKTDRKMYVLWIHEALLDASELWWRAAELKNADTLPGDMLLAHDEEQRKVFNYLDREGHPRSLSDLVAITKEHPAAN